MTYVEGSAQATDGGLLDNAGIRWFGQVPAAQAVTITSQVQVEEVSGVTLINLAAISDATLAEPVILRAQTVIPPIWYVYLPLVLEGAP